MPKIIECAKLDPSSGCKHVVRGNTVDVPEERYGTCQAPWDSGDNA
jgi:hypothetical protein